MFLLIYFEIVHTESSAYITMWKESWIMSDQRGSDGGVSGISSDGRGRELHSLADEKIKCRFISKTASYFSNLSLNMRVGIQCTLLSLGILG